MASPVDPYESIRPLLWDALDLIEPEAGLLPNSNAPSEAEQDAAIVKHLQTWLPVAEGPSTERRALYYILGDKPLEGPLSLDKLEGRAQVVSQRMTKICSDLEIDLFLAVLEKEDIGDPRYDPYDHYGGMGGHYDDDFGENEDEDEKEETPEPEQRDMGEIDEMNYSLKEVFDIVTGECLKSETWVDEGEIIQDADTYFEEAEPDEALDEGPGSFRQAITNYYRRPVLVMVPAKWTVAFLGWSNQRANLPARNTLETTILDWYMCICLQPSAKPWHLEILQGTASTMLIPNRKLREERNDLMEKLFQITMIHRRYEYLEYILDNRTVQIPGAFLQSAATNFGEDEKLWSILGKRLRSPIDGIEQPIQKRHEMLLELSAAAVQNAGPKAQIDATVDDTCSLIFRLPSTAGKEDGKALYEMVLLHKGFDYIRRQLSPSIQAAELGTSFMLGFLRALRRGIKRTEIPRAEALGVYLWLSSTTIENMNLWNMSLGLQRQPDYGASRYLGHNAPVFHSNEEIVDPEMLTAFMDSLNEYKYGATLSNLLTKFIKRVKSIPVEAYHQLYIPVLHGLIASFQKHKIPLLQPAVEAVFKTVLDQYILKYIGPEPLAPDWSPPLATCCDLCHRLVSFLRDHSQQRTTLYGSIHSHSHISDTLLLFDLPFEYTISGPSENPITVKKKANAKAKPHDQWMEDRLTAENHISTFDQDKLKLLLGDRYDEITTLRKVTRFALPPPEAHGSIYARSILYLSSNPSAGIVSPDMPSSASPEPGVRRTNRYGNIRNFLVSTKSPGQPPGQPPGTPKPTVYPVFTFKSAPQHREPLTPKPAPETNAQKLARLQDQIARAGGIPTPSEKRRALAPQSASRINTPQRPPASQASQASQPYQKTPLSAARPTAGVKRKANFIDLTLDSD